MYRRTGVRSTLLCMIAGGSLVCALATGTDVAPESNTLVLETLLKQQAAAFDAIKTVEMEYSYRIERVAEPKYGPDGELAVSGGLEVQTGTIHCWLDDDDKRDHHKYQRVYPKRGAIMRETEERIITPSRFVLSMESATLVAVYHLDEQRASQPLFVAERESIPWRNVLEYGFLPGKRQLLSIHHDHKARSSGKYRYTWLVYDGGGKPFRIRIEVSGDDTSWTMRELTIDQHRGFLVTSDKIYDRQGKLIFEVSVEPRQVTPSIWVPENVSERDGVNEWTVEMTLADIQVNMPIPEDQFALEAMWFDAESVVMMEHFPNRDAIPKAFYGGVWISKAQWPEELKQRIDALPRHPRVARGFNGIWVQGSPVDE